MAKYTDWQPFPTDAVFVNTQTGETEYSWKWVQYNDDEIPIDLTDSMAEGETPTNLSAHLWLLPATDEVQELVAADDKIEGAPSVTGNVVRVRLNELAFQRVYRLYVGFGPAGNHRNVTAVIEVVA